MQAEAGASVAAVFDLGSDLIMLNLLLSVVLLSAVVIPSLLWYDNSNFEDLLFNITSPNETDCSNFPLNSYNTTISEEGRDQMWSWLTSASNESICPVNDDTDTKLFNNCSGVKMSSNNYLVGILK